MYLCLGDFLTRNIGFERVSESVGVINPTYNICRYEQIVRLNLEVPFTACKVLIKKYFMHINNDK
jgi:hypothetical protein